MKQDTDFSWIDISVSIFAGELPLWPESPQVETKQRLSLDKGDPVNDSNLFMNLHAGTHIESPAHFISDGLTVDELPLEKMIGHCFVADLENQKDISAKALEGCQIPSGVKRILFKTSNSKNWSSEFNENFVGLTLDGAQWLANHDFVLVGNDYLSVQPYKGNDDIHRTLLKKDIVVLEGVNLSKVKPGHYEMMCLPIKLKNVEAAPARVLIRPLKEKM